MGQTLRSIPGWADGPTGRDAPRFAPSCSVVDRAAGDPVDLLLRLTLVMTLLFPGDLWFHRISMRMLAVCGFISPVLVRSPWYWFVLFGLSLAVQNFYNWAACDNHMWLMSYWYLAVGLSLGSGALRGVLAINGRLLLSLTFLFAVLKKLSAEDYVSGAAFRFLLQSDVRFFEVAKLMGGHTQQGHEFWKTMAELQPVVSLHSSLAMDRLACLLTWWTLGIESLLGVLFLIDAGAGWCGVFRNWLLLLFVATTYPIAPVLGFAWILLIMGLAQCPLALQRTRFAYLAGFALVYAFYGEQLKMQVIEWWYGNEFFSFSIQPTL